MEVSEGLAELVIGDPLVLDVDAVEDRLVKEAALLLVAASVQLSGALQQLQTRFDETGAVGEVFVCGAEALGEPVPLALDLTELRLDLGLWDGAVCCEVDQVVLASVERAKLVRELLVQEPGGGLLLTNHLADVSADVRDEGWTEADGGVVRFDGILDQENVDVRRIAGTALFVAAEEVGVGGALGVDDVLEDHASGLAGALAASAEQ